MSEDSLKKSFVFIYPSLSVGGAQRVATEYVNALVENGNYVFAVGFNKNHEDCFRDFGIKSRFRIIEPVNLWALISILRLEQPEYVFIVQPHFVSKIIIIKWLLRFKFLVIWRETNSRKGKFGGLKESTSTILYKFLGRFADVGITPSSQIKIVSKKVIELPNPCDIDRVTNYGRRDVNSGESPSPSYILGLGRLVRQKRFDLLIRAYQSSQELRMKYNLVIVGEGPLRDELKKLADQPLGTNEKVGSIIFTGYSPNPLEWISGASIFALTSDWEGMPNALIEAYCCNIPIVATDCCYGPREILDGDAWSRLCECGSSAELTDALISCSTFTEVPSRDIKRFSRKRIMEQLLASLENR